MTENEFNKAMNNLNRQLESQNNGDLMVRVAISALTKIKQRVQEEGKDAKGNKYKGYSTKPMLTNCSTMALSACESVAGSKDKRKQMQWRTVNGHKLFILPGGYKQYRELHGRQTDHVDFMFSGRMWASIGLRSNMSQHQKAIAIIGSREDKEKKKLAGNTSRRGDILDLSDKEIGELSQTYKLSTLQIYKQNGF